MKLFADTEHILKNIYCIVSYRIVLYCIVLYCIVLYCIVLYCIVFCCIVLYSIALYCIAFHCILLNCIVLYWTLLTWYWRYNMILTWYNTEQIIQNILFCEHQPCSETSWQWLKIVKLKVQILEFIDWGDDWSNYRKAKGDSQEFDGALSIILTTMFRPSLVTTEIVSTSVNNWINQAKGGRIWERFMLVLLQLEYPFDVQWSQWSLITS